MSKKNTKRVSSKKKVRIAINGFGRIGRAAFEVALSHKEIEIVAINDLTDTKTLSHLLTYDTVYGKFDREVKYDDSGIIVDRKRYQVLSVKDPKKLPWKKMKIDVVLECTGRFVKNESSKSHIDAGAKRVIISAPSKGTGSVTTYVKGVNDTSYDKKDKLISNASCTTNCISPIMRILSDAFGVEKAFMTTIHGYTSSQNLVDGPHKDLRRARAAAQNIIPTTTGAAIATTKVLPDLGGKFDGIAMRVPVIDGSLSDFTVITEKEVTVKKINDTFKKASRNPIYKGVIDVTDVPIVSSDIIGNSHSAIIDLNFTKVIGGNMVKILAWYDNEWGYANRLVEMAKVVSQN